MEALPGLTLFDAIVLAVVGLSALVGLVRGGVAEVLGLASWVGAAALAVVALPHVRPFVREAAGGNGLVADVAGFAGAFVVALLALKLLTAMVGRLVAASPLGGLDKLLGLAFGAVRGALLVCAAYLLASQFVRPDRQPAWVNDAALIRTVREGAAGLARLVPEPAAVPFPAGPAAEPPAAGAPAPPAKRGSLS